MKDIMGQEMNVGDYVACVENNTSSGWLRVAIIEKLTPKMVKVCYLGDNFQKNPDQTTKHSLNVLKINHQIKEIIDIYPERFI